MNFLLPVLTVILSLAVIFYESISALYGFHNDYSLLLANKGLLNFYESLHLFWIGRPLGALLINVPFNSIESVMDFVTWRCIGFGTMIAYIICLFFFLVNRFKITYLWAALSVTAIALLPTSLLYVIWITNWSPGFVNLLIALASYVVFDMSRRGWGNKGKIYGFILFQISLMIYPPTSLSILFFSFLHIYLADSSNFKQARAYVVQDLAFLSINLLFFALLNILVIHPIVIKFSNGYVLTSPEYQMSIGFASQKIQLFIDTIMVSFAGTWHLMFYEYGFLYWIGAMFILLILNLKQILKQKLLYIEKFLWICLIIVVMNLPTLLPKGNLGLLGYRVLFPTAVLGVMCIYSGFMLYTKQHPYKEKFILSLVLLVTFFIACMANTHLMRVVTSYAKEYEIIKQTLNTCDPNKLVNYVYVRLPKGKNLSAYRLPYEFSFMITGSQHLVPFVSEHLYSKHSIKHAQAFVVMPEDVIDFNPYDTCFIRPDALN